MNVIEEFGLLSVMFPASWKSPGKSSSTDTKIKSPVWASGAGHITCTCLSGWKDPVGVSVAQDRKRFECNRNIKRWVEARQDHCEYAFVHSGVSWSSSV